MVKNSKKIIASHNSTKELILDAFSELSYEKNLKKEDLAELLESCMRVIIKKEFQDDSNYTFILNHSKGDIEIFKERTVVNDFDLVDSNKEILISEAHLIDDTAEIGDIICEEFNITNFSRTQLHSLKQVLKQRLQNYEKNKVFEIYTNNLNTNIVGTVIKITKYDILVEHDGNTLILPRTKTITGDFFNKGDTVRAVIETVNLKNGAAEVILSRTSTEFVKNLLTLEIKEIASGEIAIVSIARSPGKLCRILVDSYNEWQDPSDVLNTRYSNALKTISKSLLNEKIQVFKMSNDLKSLANKALGTNIVNQAELYDNILVLWIKSKDFGIAIGNNGENVKLASELLNHKIQILKDGEIYEDNFEDVDLKEFIDEIDPMVILILEREGYQTAKQVMALKQNEIASICDVELSEAASILRILHAEFE